jgi:hypothetical protein
MIVIFARTTHWISRVIRIRTRCKWSHVAVVCGGYVVEAKGSFFDTKEGKVCYTPIFEFLAKYDECELRYVKGSTEKAISYLGIDFDHKGIFGRLLGINFHNVEKIFCSQHLALASTAYEDHEAHLKVPKDILFISEDIIGNSLEMKITVENNKDVRTIHSNKG